MQVAFNERRTQLPLRHVYEYRQLREEFLKFGNLSKRDCSQSVDAELYLTTLIGIRYIQGYYNVGAK